MNLKVKQFLFEEGTIFDVRSPSEFSKGHIPGAINLPMFSDQQRAQVGTAYVQEGKEQAIKLGLQYVGPKLDQFVNFVQKNLAEGTAKVHCWRGGKRSQSISWLLDQAEISSITLDGGYKAYRKWIKELFSKKRNFFVLGGLTGVGKTEILHILKDRGEQVLDLEGLARHKGSRFGSFDNDKQPTTEQFHNDIAKHIIEFEDTRPIWVEDEGLKIGACHMPEELYLNLRSSNLIVIERPIKERVDHLSNVYGTKPKEELIQAVNNITKKLGGANAQKTIDHIRNNEIKKAVEIVLKYYDSTYTHSLSKREQPITKIYHENLDSSAWSDQLLTSGS